MWKSPGFNTQKEAWDYAKMLWKDGNSGFEYVTRGDKFYVYYR
jgi:hypothetical protein